MFEYKLRDYDVQVFNPNMGARGEYKLHVVAALDALEAAQTVANGYPNGDVYVVRVTASNERND